MKPWGRSKNVDFWNVLTFKLLSTENILCFPGSSDGKSACSSGDLGSIPGSGRSPEEENGNRLQYSCLEDPTGRGIWQAIVHGVPKSRTQLREHTQNEAKNNSFKSLQPMEEVDNWFPLSPTSCQILLIWDPEWTESLFFSQPPQLPTWNHHHLPPGP